MTLTAYRITKRAHAATLWSGSGARDYGGRWNSKGVAVAYAAENRSLAALEQLVHLVQPRVLKGFVVSSIAFDDSQVERVEVNALPRGWNDPVALPALRRFGDDWIATGGCPVLAVPSVITRGEWNYLIHPAHPEFDRLPRSVPEPFVYDVRLGLVGKDR